MAHIRLDEIEFVEFSFGIQIVSVIRTRYPLSSPEYVKSRLPMETTTNNRKTGFLGRILMEVVFFACLKGVFLVHLVLTFFFLAESLTISIQIMASCLPLLRAAKWLPLTKFFVLFEGSNHHISVSQSLPWQAKTSFDNMPQNYVNQ